MFGLRN